MKRKRIFTVFAVLCCTILVSAKELGFENPKTSISEQLQSILSQNVIDIEKNDVMARVLFKVDSEGKIELNKVYSERKDVVWFLNRKLEGKRLAVDDEALDEVFVVNVRVTS